MAMIFTVNDDASIKYVKCSECGESGEGSSWDEVYQISDNHNCPATNQGKDDDVFIF